MFLIGYNNIGGCPNSFFDSQLSPNDFNKIELRNSVIDEVYADNDITLPYSTEKRQWDFNTVFLGTFDNTYECGNIQSSDVAIETVRFKKRLKGNLEWIFIEELLYEKSRKYYYVIDRLAYSLDEYEYGLFPVSQGVEGEPVISSIVCTFEGLWIVDRDENYQMFYDLKYGDIDCINKVKLFELLENKYPMIQSGVLQYDKGSNSAVIIGDKTGRGGINVDYLGDKKELDKVTEFFRSGRPKVWKDGYGVKRLVILDNVKITPNPQTRGGVCTVSFDWSEIGNATSTDDLINNGLLPEML